LADSTDAGLVSERLLDLLEARRGIVCAVGAGGKKSTLDRLFEAHPGRVALTTTVRTTKFRELPDTTNVVAPEQALERQVSRAARATRRVAYARLTDKPGRHGDVRGELIEHLHCACGFDLTLVKADGARMRWIKAPADDEPVVPPGTRTLIGVVSARVFGEPLTDRIAHRVERVTVVTGARAGEALTPLHVARLLSSPDGLLRASQGRIVVPVINMVDDDERRRYAAQAAERALDMTDRFDYVVLASLQRQGDPVVDVIRR
jgi:probable selenium-dependent hydroxylase accessory protein YqeC